MVERPDNGDTPRPNSIGSVVSVVWGLMGFKRSRSVSRLRGVKEARVRGSRRRTPTVLAPKAGGRALSLIIAAARIAKRETQLQFCDILASMALASLPTEEMGHALERFTHVLT